MSSRVPLRPASPRTGWHTPGESANSTLALGRGECQRVLRTKGQPRATLGAASIMPTAVSRLTNINARNDSTLRMKIGLPRVPSPPERSPQHYRHHQPTPKGFVTDWSRCERDPRDPGPPVQLHRGTRVVGVVPPCVQPGSKAVGLGIDLDQACRVAGVAVNRVMNEPRVPVPTGSTR